MLFLYSELLANQGHSRNVSAWFLSSYQPGSMLKSERTYFVCVPYPDTEKKKNEGSLSKQLQFVIPVILLSLRST